MHTLTVELIDSTDDYFVLRTWRLRGWRITHKTGDRYQATQTIKVAA
ncbi:hypothetical protein HQN60_12505 [Deefgea piscis]|uniref:Uncharacterized protein n=1 Tax=Deefgea piscis TaxID=2739061 RepID=A0A6M8SXY4_9NEIS|nr:hypothetical protein [Deefgea piscis]QKJ67459.1 hypothetical protein HQN60_12505 [Deefgea piscis]